jgi:RNA-directed DNA polymerase
MNIAMTMCAPSNGDLDWHSINWKQVQSNVKKQQWRIAKAVKEGRWNKAKALQRLLTSSFSAKALAVRRVSENRGKKTAGVDKETWSTPKQKAIAIDRLRKHGYKPKPLRRIYIPKASSRKELRPLSIPCMIDRAMQSLHLLALEPIAETRADKHSYGFRPMRSTADAIEQCFRLLCRKHSAKFILKADIKACFDSVSHSYLEATIPMDKRILKQWLKAGFMDKGQYYDTATGLAQGSPIAPIIMNMTLDGLEALLAKTFRRKMVKGVTTYPRVNIVRFADDVLLTAQSKENLLIAQKLIEDFLAERGLELSKTKTRIVHIDEGFDFLGQNLRKYKDKLIIKPSKKNLASFLTKVRALVKLNCQSPQDKLIVVLNPVIKGWANYHQYICASTMFSKVDAELWQMLWYWAKRRHPKKSTFWLKKRYFPDINSETWVFSCMTDDPKTKSGKRFIRLTKARFTLITRHIKLKAEAHPFDPEYETYFEQRLKQQMLSKLKGRYQLLAIWKRQKGKCLICRQVISKQTSWHLHHLIPKAKGGSNTQANLVLLHPNCHRQVHNNLDLSNKLLALTKEGL